MIRGLPEKFLDPLGGNSVQYFFVWFFIAAWTFIDPGFYQRSAAAETPEVARKGILTAIIFWAIFDTLNFLWIICNKSTKYRKRSFYLPDSCDRFPSNRFFWTVYNWYYCYYYVNN